MVKDMDEQQKQDLIKWAEEISKKCKFKQVHILAAHARVNGRIKDSEKAKVVVANELINGK